MKNYDFLEEVREVLEQINDQDTRIIKKSTSMSDVNKAAKFSTIVNALVLITCRVNTPAQAVKKYGEVLRKLESDGNGAFVRATTHAVLTALAAATERQRVNVKFFQSLADVLVNHGCDETGSHVNQWVKEQADKAKRKGK